jgi:hypothetical protein
MLFDFIQPKRIYNTDWRRKPAMAFHGREDGIDPTG